MNSLWYGTAHLGVGINLKTIDTGVESRNLGDVVVLALTLLLLELEGDAADGAALDTLHQMGREARDLVPETLRGYNSLNYERTGYLEIPR